MAQIMDLPTAIGDLVRDGDVVAMEGFSHLIPFAAGHEIVRQRRRDLTLVRLTPDVIGDQLIGMGCVRKLIFGWGGNPGVGSLHRLRDAVERSWPVPLLLEEHSHAVLANRFVAGASGLPFAVLRASNGTGLAGRSESVSSIECPFTGQSVTAVAAIQPDVGIIHAQQADRQGNVALWGITGVQKETVLASKRSLATVEELVNEFSPRKGLVVLPSWAITTVACAPGGTHPSYAEGYSNRDNDFYEAWDGISRDRETFLTWMTEHVLEAQ